MPRPRPHMPMKVKLDAAVLQLGLDPSAVDFDHDPALGIRVFNEETGKYEPDANDPKFITVRSRERDGEGHKAKTFGAGGTTAGSDIGRIAKIKRFERAKAALEEATDRTSRPKPRQRPLSGTRASGVRKRMDGRVERW